MRGKNIEQFMEWQKRAEEDFGSAGLLLEEKSYPAVVSFHAHQVVEKYLKGYLAYYDRDPLKIHQLDVLLEKCSKIDKSFKNYVEEAASLNDYYIEARYPLDIKEDISLDESRKALEKADVIRKFVLSKIDKIKQ